MWVLIVWMLSNSGATSTTQEFTTQENCKQAFARIKEVNDGYFFLRGVCVEK